jgi:hypothetical protein
VQLHIQKVWPDLAQALEAFEDAQAGETDLRPDLLLVTVNGLSADTAQQVQALSQRVAPQQTGVLHSFGQSGAVTRLRHAGVHVHREPLNDQALASWLRNAARPALTAPAAPTGWAQVPNAPVPARLFSDAVLQRVVDIPNQLLCECPRHVAELIGQLGRFEDYSRDCLNQSPKDAQLHARLHQMAASARALLEHALQMVATHEGISLEESV